jgi:hypothetical protein
MKFKPTVLLFTVPGFKRDNTASNPKKPQIGERCLGVFPVKTGHFSSLGNVGKHIAKSCL